MANLWWTLNGQKLFAALPSEQGREPIGTTLDMASGNRRIYRRPAKPGRRRWTLVRPRADEATRATWLAAADFTQAVTLVTPEGQSYTVAVMDLRDPISKSTPAAGQAGSATATGALFFDLAIDVEEL